jgi:hypothetical protein
MNGCGKRLTASLLMATACVGLAACSRLPKNARGQTPFRYVQCNATGQDCFVEARFDTQRNCERYRELDAAGQSKATAYCLP